MNLNEDKFAFGEGFFAAGPGGEVELSEVLLAWNLGGGDTALVANTAESGWEAIAYLDGVNAITLSQKIANGSILDIELSDLAGGPGGVASETPPPAEIGVQLGLIL